MRLLVPGGAEVQDPGGVVSPLDNFAIYGVPLPRRQLLILTGEMKRADTDLPASVMTVFTVTCGSVRP